MTTDDARSYEAESTSAPQGADQRQSRTQAKELRRAARQGHPDSVALFTAHHPEAEHLTASPESLRDITLREAQLVLAKSRGTATWHDLIQLVGTSRVEEREMHRWFGVEFNNEVWGLIDDGLSAGSPLDDRELALSGAYAALRHWTEAGTRIHQARAHHLISRVAVTTGFPDVALAHARRCLDLVTENPDEAADWDSGFAYEALARATAATGDSIVAGENRRRAEQIAADIGDPEDREILVSELRREPWFGLVSTAS